MRSLLLTFLSLAIFTVKAQPPCSTIPGMNPQTAIAVCGATTFTQNSVASCLGSPISGTGACGGANDSHNAFWYKFHCYQSGLLGFLVTPMNLSDDYDWELFNVTGLANLNQIYTDERLMVSLNLCGSPNGVTGCTAAGIDSINCGGATSLINRRATIYAGNDYMLMVNNWSNSGLGYTLQFAGGTAVITDPTVPVISSVTTVGCNTSLLKVTFSKDIVCNSVSGDGSEFSITPGAPVVNSAIAQCPTGFSTITELTIQLQTPLASGNYNLLVNQGSDGNTFKDVCGNDVVTGFSIPFTVTATPPPVIQSVTFDQCHLDKLVVNFDKPVSCASITAAGSELNISPGVWPVSSITYNCISSLYTTQITMNLVNPLPAGNFNVVVGNGTDGNTLSDTCSSFMPVGYTKAFTTTAPPAPIFDSVQFDNCNATALKVFYSHPILCSSISSNGSDFTITGPSAVNITSATTDVTCAASGYTHWVLLQLQSPISLAGNYVLHNGIGMDGNGIIDTCNAKQNTNETFAINILGKPSAVFNSQVNWGCAKDTILLSHPGGNGVNSWIWNFSDGQTASGQNVSMVFPVDSPSITVQLTVNNGFCSDTKSVVITLGNVFNAAFTASTGDTICINTPVNFIDASTGTLTNYLWNFGDLTQFNGQNPPTHIYSVSNIYNVQLIVTDNHGCRDTASKLMHVDASALIDFTGLKPQYCTDKTVTLKRVISRNITSYVWDNGDGKTFTNEVDVSFSYPNEGVYTITLSGVDKYCGAATVSKTVPVYSIPRVNLGSDTVLCFDSRLLIGVQPQPNYTYLWGTGETTSQIYTWAFLTGSIHFL